MSWLDQIKEHKLRMSTAEQGNFLKRVGATPVQVTSAEVPAALERGIVEGVLTASAGGSLGVEGPGGSRATSWPSTISCPASSPTPPPPKLPADVQAKIHALVNESSAELTADLQRDDVGLRRARRRRHHDDRRHGRGPRQRRVLARETADVSAKSRGPEANQEPGQGAHVARPIGAPGEHCPDRGQRIRTPVRPSVEGALVAMMVLIAAKLVLRIFSTCPRRAPRRCRATCS